MITSDRCAPTREQVEFIMLQQAIYYNLRWVAESDLEHLHEQALKKEV